jgi:FlaA1/EpsC-like NDP-sugar epimerase
MERLARRVAAQGVRRLTVYGAGEAGHELARALREYGVAIDQFVDRNTSLWGNQIAGAEVVSLAVALERGADVFAVGSFAFVAEIRDTLLSCPAGRPVQVHAIDDGCPERFRA